MKYVFLFCSYMIDWIVSSVVILRCEINYDVNAMKDKACHLKA